jgi:iron complex outermembrane receptor protein
MYRLVKYLFLVIASVYGQSVYGQITDTTINMKTVSVVASRLNKFSVGEKIQKISSVDLDKYSSNKIDAVLEQEALVNILNYGTSGLSTIRMRGAAADRTAILWNGFNIQPPMSGETNLFTIPAVFVDQVKLHFGGEGALGGSGAIGGIVEMNNSLKFEKGLFGKVYSGIGSFDTYQFGAKVAYSNSKVASNISVNKQSAENNFTFTNKYDFLKREMTMQNSAYNQLGFAQNNSFKLGERAKLNTFLWVQNSYREVAQQIINVVPDNYEEFVEEDDVRFIAEYKQPLNRWQLDIANMVMHTRMRYNKPSILTDDTHKTLTNDFKVKLYHEFERNSVLGFLLETRGYWINSGKLPNADGYNETYIAANYKYTTNNKKHTAAINIREGYVRNDFTPLIYSLQLKSRVANAFVLKAKFARNYKVPDLNDIYWAGPGAIGNPDLKPERGYSGDFTLSFARMVGDIDVKIDATGYYSDLEDMIIWKETRKGGSNATSVWTPVNYKRVKTSGAELGARLETSIGLINMALRMSYNYTRPELSDSESEHNGNITAYTPLHSGVTALEVAYNRYYLSYSHRFVGERYTFIDNKNTLDAYSLGNIKAGAKVKLLGGNVNITASVNNVWNTDYEIREYYAQFPVNYRFGLGFEF